MTFEALKITLFKEIANDKTFLVLDKFDELLKTKTSFSSSDNYTKLLKQISYDYLVKKRRKYSNDDLGKCKNPAKFPDEDSPFDKTNHIDCLTAWTEDWEDIKCGEMEFKYLKNLDADIVILGKDSSGQETHTEHIDKFKSESTINDHMIRKYVNKDKILADKIDERIKKYLDPYRFGFSPLDVKTNIELTKYCCEYLNEIIGEIKDKVIEPKENKNIFLTNSFVFLSAAKKSSSSVPAKIFSKSADEFIVPLLDIIKPKVAIQCGLAAVSFVNKSIYKIYKSKYADEIYKKHSPKNLGNILVDTHKEMLKDEFEPKDFLYHTDWNKKGLTYFLPVKHPAYPEYYMKNEQFGHLVWKHIKKILEMMD